MNCSSAPDVVPVEPSTLDQWVEPPYSGLYDGPSVGLHLFLSEQINLIDVHAGTWIWGRGSVDDKSTVVSLLYVPLDCSLTIPFL